MRDVIGRIRVTGILPKMLRGVDVASRVTMSRFKIPWLNIFESVGGDHYSAPCLAFRCAEWAVCWHPAIAWPR